MGFLSSEVTLDLPYAPDDCYKASKSAVNKLSKFSVKSENVLARMLQISVSPGLTSWTWGDIVNVTISANADGTSKVSVSSQAKNHTSGFGAGQQSKNVQQFVDALTEELQAYTSITATAQTIATPAQSTAKERLATLVDLHKDGLISDEEFEKKKAEILSQI